MKKIYVTALLAALGTSPCFAQHFVSGYSFSTRICNGALFITGSNSYGQLGNGVTGGIATSPAAVTALSSNVSLASGGGSHCLALKNDGSVWAWGWNNFGQLGDGTTTDSDVPLQVSGLNNVIKISAGSNHNMALLSNGDVYTWGYNSSGQLGNNSTSTSKTPIQVTGISNVTQIAAGRYHSMALKNDGTLWVWGSNSFGQLGNGTTTQSKVPIQISLSNVTQIVAGEEQSFALKSDGTVWAWGNNSLGQLGNGNNTLSNAPVQVSGLTGVKDISSMLGDHCVAVKNDGTVWAWGYNFYGQLGNNSSTNSNIPVQVSGLTGVNDVEAGGNHCLAMKNDGSIWAWGSNVNGQLGNGSSSSKKTPVHVGDLCVYQIVGIKEHQSSGPWHVYPNPVSEKLSMYVNHAGTIQLYDQAGRMVKMIDCLQGSNELDMADLHEGVYMLHLKTPTETYRTKVVKTK